MKLFDYVVSGPNKAPPEMPNLKVPLNVTQPCAWPMTLEAMPVSPGNIMRLDRADFLRSVESLINLKVVIDSWMQHLWKNVHINISEGMLNHRLCNCFSWKRGRKRVISNYISHSLFLCTLFFWTHLSGLHHKECWSSIQRATLTTWQTTAARSRFILDSVALGTGKILQASGLHTGRAFSHGTMAEAYSVMHNVTYKWKEIRKVAAEPDNATLRKYHQPLQHHSGSFMLSQHTCGWGSECPSCVAGRFCVTSHAIVVVTHISNSIPLSARS